MANEKLALLRRWILLPAEPAHWCAVGRMVLLAGLVGIVAGLGAVAFQYLSHLLLKYGLEFSRRLQACRPYGRMEHLLAHQSRSSAAFRPG